MVLCPSVCRHPELDELRRQRSGQGHQVSSVLFDRRLASAFLPVCLFALGYCLSSLLASQQSVALLPLQSVLITRGLNPGLCFDSTLRSQSSRATRPTWRRSSCCRTRSCSWRPTCRCSKKVRGVVEFFAVGSLSLARFWRCSSRLLCDVCCALQSTSPRPSLRRASASSTKPSTTGQPRLLELLVADRFCVAAIRAGIRRSPNNTSHLLLARMERSVCEV
jgi:hypothetical protein